MNLKHKNSNQWAYQWGADHSYYYLPIQKAAFHHTTCELASAVASTQISACSTHKNLAARKIMEATHTEYAKKNATRSQQVSNKTWNAAFVSLFLFVSTYFWIFVRKFLVHLRTVYAYPRKLARPLTTEVNKNCAKNCEDRKPPQMWGAYYLKLAAAVRVWTRMAWCLSANRTVGEESIERWSVFADLGGWLSLCILQPASQIRQLVRQDFAVLYHVAEGFPGLRDAHLHLHFVT